MSVFYLHSNQLRLLCPCLLISIILCCFRKMKLRKPNWDRLKLRSRHWKTDLTRSEGQAETLTKKCSQLTDVSFVFKLLYAFHYFVKSSQWFIFILCYFRKIKIWLWNRSKHWDQFNSKPKRLMKVLKRNWNANAYLYLRCVLHPRSLLGCLGILWVFYWKVHYFDLIFSRRSDHSRST